jgi:LmbE family N-acetylglucosaminyl deacetylase
MRTKLSLVLLIVFLCAAQSAREALLGSASDPAEDRGAMGLSQALNRMDVVASVLYTGAHPDDENSALLAWLSRGQGVRVAYLSATRGEGGRNLLGPELFEALGVIRTEELLAARRLDRSQQFFTPNYEFGYSKSADETLRKWGRDEILGDFVRVIRQFRPEIIVSGFTGTPRDGHGHHQTVGMITQEAFSAAADAARFPQFGPPWQAKKLYMGARGDDPVSVSVNVGEYDPALGRSHSQIAAEGRSLHRSQSQGSAQDPGPRNVGLRLVRPIAGDPVDAGLFGGVLHRISDLAQLDSTIGADVRQLQDRVAAIRERTNLMRPADAVPDLIGALKQLQQIRARSANEQVQFLLRQKEADFQEALRLAAGLVLDVVASEGPLRPAFVADEAATTLAVVGEDDKVIPGQELNLTVSVINGGPYPFPTVRAAIDLPPGWEAIHRGSTGTLLPGQRLDQKFVIRIPAGADFTQPYWLRQPRQGDRFTAPPGSEPSMAFDPPLLMSRAEIDYDGATIAMSRVAEFKRVDNMLGEQRSLVKVVPAMSVRIMPEIAVIPLTGNRQKEFTVTVENQNPGPADADVRLVTPPGWTTQPTSRSVKFTRQGEKVTVPFTVTAPPISGDFTVQAIVKSGSQEFSLGYIEITYPHVETRHIYSRAESKAQVFDVKSLATSIGYVEGSGDSVPEALRQLGIVVRMLSPQDVATTDLSQFPVIVLGIRAYGVREDLRAYNSRFMDYVSNGGTLVVQYNIGGESPNQIGPYPFTLLNSGTNNQQRVTDETAPVRILDRANPVLNAPNRITEADFDGWVAERGTHFLQNWDPRYIPLLESNDPGEDGRQGGIVVAKYGKGSYVYAGYAFFRQLPAGVKGAYRLFANLVSIEN